MWPLLPRGSVELASLVSHARPPLSRLEILQTMELATETGWRMQLVTAEVRGAEGTIETRLAALYEVVHWAGFALAIASDPASYDRHRQALVEMFTSATPDLHALEPACVKDLFRMDSP